MNIMARNVIVLFFLYLATCNANIYASESSIIVGLDNLQYDADYAKKNSMMLLIVVTLPTCSICEYVKTEHIKPMIKAGNFSDIAIVRELSLEEYTLTDFDGSAIGSEEFVRRYDANFSPTVLFLSPEGEQLHKPLIGVSSRDYYGFYLNKAIKKAAKLVDKK